MEESGAEIEARKDAKLSVISSEISLREKELSELERLAGEKQKTIEALNQKKRRIESGQDY